MASFARGLASLTRIRLSTSKTPLQTIHHRGLADYHGPRNYTYCEEEDRADLVQLGKNLLYCGLVFYVGFKLGASGQGKKEEVMPKESTEA